MEPILRRLKFLHHLPRSRESQEHAAQKNLITPQNTGRKGAYFGVGPPKQGISRRNTMHDGFPLPGLDSLGASVPKAQRLCGPKTLI